MIVISRKAMDDMRGETTGKIAEAFGVRYVLEGAIRGQGDKLRVNARLQDSLSGQTIWADQWDRDTGQVLDLQDEISDKIFEELQVRLTLGEQARDWRARLNTPENLKDLIQGREAFQLWTPDSHIKAREHFERIYTRNPEIPSALTLMGWIHWQRIVIQISDDPAADFAAARALGEKAIEMGGDGTSHIFIAVLEIAAANYDAAIENAEQAMASTPGDSDVLNLAGWTLAAAGLPEQGIDLMQRGMRLEPNYPEWVASGLAYAHLMAGDLDAARDVAGGVLASDGTDMRSRYRSMGILAAVAVWQGDMPEARKQLSGLIGIVPSMTRTKLRAANGNARDTAFVDRYLDALVAAGLPDT
jgi:tetratricopeptide (TPR) repeat protein